METSRVNLAGLAVAFIAGLAIFRDSQSLLGCLAGLTLLITLLGFGHDKNRTGLQSLAFGAICGLAALDACFFPLTVVVGPVKSFLGQDIIPPAFWLLGTAIFWFVDRSGSDSGSPQPVSLSSAVYSQAPAAASAPAPTPVPRPAFAPPIPQPVMSGTAETEMHPDPTPTPPAPAMAGSTPAAPVPPVLTGKEVSIYVTMVGEGMNMLRPVRAEHLGRDFYIIVEDMPSDENWEFVPGQVVRCKKKNLSNGKGLVAFEEAPRAQ